MASKPMGMVIQQPKQNTSGPTKFIQNPWAETDILSVKEESVAPQNGFEAHGQSRPKSKTEVPVAPQNGFETCGQSPK